MKRETRSDHELLRAVADRTLSDNFGVWHWGDAIALDGLLEASAVLNDPRYEDFARRLLTEWAELKVRDGITWVDFLAPAGAILDAYERSGDGVLLDAARSLGELLLAATTTSDGLPLHRPDQADRRNWAWVDTTYHEPPFLCRLGRVLEEVRYIDMGAEVMLAHARALLDPATGFYHHAYDSGERQLSGTLWGRGQGWIVLGFADTLAELPVGHPHRKPICALLEGLLDRLMEKQDATGYWHTVIDDRNTYLETSIGAFVVAAVGRANEFDRQARWDEMAATAWQALRERVSADGAVLGVTRDTFARFDNPQHYRDRPFGVNAWGQGIFLRAAAIVCSGRLSGGGR